MRFSEIVNHAVVLLQEAGRLTHRALKREFDLDDEALADLVGELIDARRVARDENGRMLVWRDDGGPRAGVSAEPGAGPSPTVEAAHAPVAERRQLTVMFCDIVGSTALSERLDPEDWRALLLDYQQKSTTVIERFGGHVAQYLGDGLLVYFGYPCAHEDDAGRAVRSARGIIEALGSMTAQQPEALAVRFGIHTGPVVVGTIGGGERHEQLALGETPNVAARLQGLAEPGSIVLSAVTEQLVRRDFVCTALGTHQLKGIEAPVPVFRVAAQRDPDSSEAPSRALLGRVEELGLLQRHWSSACRGAGRVILLTGEAGIGKSALVQALRGLISDEHAARIEYRCSEHYRNTALYPLVKHLKRALGFATDDPAALQLAQLERTLLDFRFADAAALPLLARLLSLPLPADDPFVDRSPEYIKQRTFDLLMAWLLEETERQPVYCAFEDLQWADASTLEFLQQFLDHVPRARLLAVLTFRPEFRPPWEPRSYLSHITVSRLGRAQVEELIGAVSGGAMLPAEVTERVVAKTDGIPLFVEELTKNVLESGLLVRDGAGYALNGTLPELAIPATLQDSLMARLDRLGGARELAQIGAALGREFDLELLRAVAELDEETLAQGLTALVDAELLYQRGRPPRARYRFKHALVQETAYHSLLNTSRRQLHARIVRVLTTVFGQLVINEPESLAAHYSAAGLPEQAIEYWLKAGERALERSANREAVEHLRKGIDLLAGVGESAERARFEVALLALLGPALIATQGYGAAETVDCFNRGHDLVESVGDSPHLFPLLYGCWVYNITWAECRTALDLGDRFLERATRSGDTGAILTGHRILGFTHSCLGNFATARMHFTQMRARYDPRRHVALTYRYGQDPWAAGTAVLAWNLWHLGFPDRAREVLSEALDYAGRLEHLNTRGYVECFGAMATFWLLRDADAVARAVESMTVLCDTRQVVFWRGFTQRYRGWLQITCGEYEDAITTIQAAHEELWTAKSQMFKPQGLAWLAEAYSGAGRHDDALREIDEALAASERSSEQWMTPELYRLRGEILCRTGTADALADAGQSYQSALDHAQRHSARGWQLRAATSLARWLRDRGRSDEARAKLVAVYETFDEGHASPDLGDARAVLAQL